MHRSGRTGRIGKKGLNIIFFEQDEFKFILNLEDELNINIEITTKLKQEEDEATEKKAIEQLISNAKKTKKLTN